jgi:hypothetical protein
MKNSWLREALDAGREESDAGHAGIRFLPSELTGNAGKINRLD